METSLDSTPLTQEQPVKRGPLGTPSPKSGFVQKRLPWVIAGAFLVLYAVTLARWVSYQGLPSLARAAGWDWQPAYHLPLHFLITYPVRWLPAEWQVIGLNLFSAICSVLTLAILARSVAILPQDRTRDQRQLEHSKYSLLSIPGAWLPPIFAALVCGLQLTFWEHSIVSTAEAFDLLLFAYGARSVLEYRLDQRNSWLYRMAFVLGLGMTSNHAMIGFLPAFVVATVWVKNRSFFNARFLVTMASLGVGGLLLYLLLPAINSASGLVDQSFWQLLKITLGEQKAAVLGFPRYIILLVALTSLFPILFIGIRWPNQLGDINVVGNALTNLMTHVIHAVFMVACLYVAFDPPFSPRKLGSGQAMLPFYYLGALSIGYFAGYFMLVFGHDTFKPWQRYRVLRKIGYKAIVALVWVAALGVPAGLAIQNLREVRKSSGPYLARMADAVVKSLPQAGAVIATDDLYRLYTIYEALNRNGTLNRYVLIHSAAMQNAAYQRYLRKKYGQRWPGHLAERPLKPPIDQPSVLGAMLTAADKQRVFYLQPTFGYYLEYFYLEPRNLVYEMKRYPAASVTPPPLSAEVLKENDVFWKQFIASDLPALRQPSMVDTPKESKRDKPQRNLTTFAVAAMYSRALTWLGVEAQKANHLEEARDYFNAALELNPDNPSAFVSLDYNRLLREGKTETTKPSEGAIKRLSPYGGNWEQIMNFNGPVDDPNACYLVAQVFARGRNFRQASQNLIRMQTLNPKGLEGRVFLAGMLVEGRFPDKALELIQQIRNEPKEKPMPAGAQMALIQSEAWAYIFKNDLASAEKVLKAAQAKYPGDDTPFSTLVEIYFRIRQTSQALALLESELKRNPDHVAALINYSVLKLEAKEYEAAIPMLDRAVKIQPDNSYALLNRAIANLHLNRLDDARRDYELIQRNQSRVPYSIHYGLGEVAWRKKERKAALKHYTDYLKNAPTGTAEHEEIEQRVKRLKSGSI